MGTMTGCARRLPTRSRDLLGQRVVLTREITNAGGVAFPAGTRMTVTQTWRGRFSLVIGYGSPCGLSGISRESFRPADDFTGGDVCYGCRSRFRIYAYNGIVGDPCLVCGMRDEEAAQRELALDRIAYLAMFEGPEAEEEVSRLFESLDGGIAAPRKEG